MFTFLRRKQSGSTSGRSRRATTRLHLEALEDRTLLSTTVTLNFDSIDTSTIGEGVVSGQVVLDYLASYGISVNGTPGVRTGTPVVIAPSSPNVFNAPITRTFLTLNFNVPLDSFSVTRAGMHVKGNGTTAPEWNATALNAQGTQLDFVSEPLLVSFQDIPAKQFTLKGPGITSIVDPIV